ncbi:MAG: MlaD family protein [Pseudomonadota bacterium]
METRANFVLIGSFTVAGILCILGFFVWLAKFQVDRTYDYYDIMFSDVSGLSQAADVRFNGLAVGRVVSLNLSRDDPSLVRVRIEVQDGLPIKRDTTAQLQVQGVTGVSFVSLSGGSQDAPAPDLDSSGVPTLRAERSIVQQITEDAPDILSEAVSLLGELRGFASPQNQRYVQNILRNVDIASGQLETALEDFSSITATVSRATDQVATFTDQLSPVATSLQRTLEQSEGLISSATAAFDDAQTTLQTATQTLQTADGALGDARGLIQTEVANILTEVSGTTTDLRQDLNRLADRADDVLVDLDQVAEVATARLVELDGTLKSIEEVMDNANATFEYVDSASIAFEDLVEGEGAELVAESRVTITKVDKALDAINAVLETDMPIVVSDIREAVETANRVVGQVGSDVTNLTGRFGPLSESAEEALDTATETLQNANRTLAGVDVLMLGASDTLDAVRTTFLDVNLIVEEEGRPTAEDIRETVVRVGDAVDRISEDLPATVADLRRVIAEASNTMSQVNAVVDRASGPVTSFAQSGLPEFTLFARELRELISRLDRIAGRLERDPARFILGGQAPDFGR